MRVLRSRTLLRVGVVSILVVLAVAGDDTSTRVQSIATKMYCDCGCGEMLSECSHLQCTRKIALRQEITAALIKGDSDSSVLEKMRVKYGPAILATPPFQGLNILLWLCPFVVALALTILLVRRWRKARPPQR
jgi:cytochrome c-type biogenesis protein CcmH/NrfF